MNITVGPKEDRQLMTGLHTVADVSCCDCREVLGWKYERAYEETQKYKEGKFILEKSKIVKENCLAYGIKFEILRTIFCSTHCIWNLRVSMDANGFCTSTEVDD
ncbi:hypothetical protein L3X38_028680 [Prunus dulcis]|uniref:Protein yippee-like n=1 Tax=Prunus dulcis TaxID=3755 RepID=A0AAD4VQE8_PRUDU|nr:hypothetical protein L3X38_028680 [Prunus dulcis]